MIPLSVLKAALAAGEAAGQDCVVFGADPKVYNLADGRIGYEPTRQTLTIDGTTQPYVDRRTKLLGYFCMHPDSVISPSKLQGTFFPERFNRGILDTAFYQMRALLPDDLADPRSGAIRVIRGQGYIGVTRLHDTDGNKLSTVRK